MTVERSDFRAADIAGEVGIAIAPRFEVVMGADWSSKSVGSEYRDFVDNNRLPIEQTTTLRELNLGVNARYNLTRRSSPLSRLAWIQQKVVPYVGGGAGVMNYNLVQAGDFVDFVDFSVFG